jgi:hypothetical protein
MDEPFCGANFFHEAFYICQRIQIPSRCVAHKISEHILKVAKDRLAGYRIDTVGTNGILSKNLTPNCNQQVNKN